MQCWVFAMVARKRKYVKRRRGRRIRPAVRRVRRRRAVKRRRLGGSGRQQTLQRLWGAAAAGTGFSYVKDAVDTVTSAYNPRKRLRTGSVRRRKPDDSGTGSFAQWTQAYKSARFGRLTGKKIDSLSLNRIIFTHRMLGPFNDYGQVFMKNWVKTDGSQEFPLMLMELNSCNNSILGTITNHSPVRTLYQYGDTSAKPKTMFWYAQPGLTSAGNVDSLGSWQMETSPGTQNSAISQAHDGAIHKWSSIDLELWGCKNKPTKFHIALCQFSEDVLPDWGDRTNQSAEFWQSMVKHYTYSPLAKIDDGFNKKKMKILKQYTYNIDPTASFENDPDPHVKTVKLYYKFNRKCNFSWQFNGPEVMTVADLNDEDYRIEHGQNQLQVHPNARLYLMIRASNFTQITQPATVDNTTNPSISWRLRTCYLVNS